jgi:hypothetical protein
MNAEDGTAYRDDLHSEIPNSCSGETYLASDSVGSLRGPDNIDSPLFGSDSSPSSPPSSPSSPSSPPPSPVTAATAPFENEMPIVVVDKKRKLEVHISDPEYERLPGAEIVKLSTEEYFIKLMTTKGSPKSPSGVCVIKLRLEKSYPSPRTVLRSRRKKL